MTWPRNWPPFLFGAATSSHQIEGHTTNDWTAWEAAGGSAEPSGRGANHWEDWRQDFDRFQAMGLNSYRLSLEWSRIEPEPGHFDESALRQYREMLMRLRELGITPMVTLHHFTLPRWMSEAGGFLHPDQAQWFARYTETIMDYMSDASDLWVTINEPMVLVVMGHIIGLWPPGHKSFPEGLRLIERLVQTHQAAYEIIKRRRPESWVGLAHHLIAFEPWTRSPLDRLNTRLLHHLMNFRFIDKIGPRQDFLGINYYARQYARWQQFLRPVTSRPGAPLTDMGWEVYPEGLGDLLQRLKPYQKPILITENGIATQNDAERQQFIQKHLAEVAAAQRDGVPVRGYYYWAALDNFEWAEGFRPRFGLIDVNYETLQRTLRPSALSYRDLIQANHGQYPIHISE